MGERSSASSASVGSTSGASSGGVRRVERPVGALGGEVVQRAVVDERGDRHVADEPLAVEDAHLPRVRHLADRRPVDLPQLADGEDLVEALGLAHAEHPLLRLGDHDLEGLHPRLAQRHARDVEVDPDAALGRHLRRARGQAGRAEVLQRDEQAAREQVERALEQLLLRERVADLDGGALVLVGLPELGRGEHGRAPDPVAAGGGAEQHERVADARGRARHQALGLAEPERHRVDEAVLLVGRLEVDLAADRRYPDRVAVVTDAGDRAIEQVARAPRGLGVAEAQRVEDRDRPRADREDVAQDPADARGRALERLDRARVVVGLDLERARQPAAHVDRAGVLARAHEHVAALGRQRAQELLGVLVGAVLAPQQREHRELDLVRGAAELLADQVVLGAGQPERDGVLDAGQDARVRRRRAHPPPPPSTRRSPGRRPSRP